MKKIVKIKITNGIKVTKRDHESHFNKIHFLITNYNKLWQNKLDQINYTKKNDRYIGNKILSTQIINKIVTKWRIITKSKYTTK